MKKNIDAWLSFSLYYHPQQWSSLIVNGISPLIREFISAGDAEMYFFMPSINRGYNLLVRIKGQKTILDKKIKPKVEKYIASYFKKHPSEDFVYPMPLNSLFMPFPNNSLQFNQYYQDIVSLGGFEGALLAEKLFYTVSDIAVQRMQEKPNRTAENILSEMLQLHFLALHSLGLNLEQAYLFSKSYLGHLMPSTLPNVSATSAEGKRYSLYLKALKKLLQERFNPNKERFSNYFASYWQMLEEGEEHDEDWILAWKNIFVESDKGLIALQEQKKFLKKEFFKPNKKSSLSPDKQERTLIYSYYIHMANMQMGLMLADEIYLHYMICEIFKSLTSKPHEQQLA
ncbi:MAG: putative Lantibiotic biosynthesis protein [Chitinophagaceae bacterium]|nr:putative Lantibiotic biosynthesis protein [Chitinophagaceae bacterium]